MICCQYELNVIDNVKRTGGIGSRLSYQSPQPFASQPPRSRGLKECQQS